jgi:hypothetical protein
VIGGRPAEILLAIGEVTKVFPRPDRAVFCEVALRHYSNGDGTPLLATVRVCVPVHGAGWGEWWVPEIGTDFLCGFPGVGTNGAAGGELDEGYAFSVLSTRQEPPLNGLKGSLSPARRVYKGREGMAHDWHHQGDVANKINGNLEHEVGGNELRQVTGNRSRTVQGEEAIEIEGDASRTFRANVDELIDGDHDHDLAGSETRLIGGNATRAVSGTETVQNTGAFSRALAALGSWLSQVKIRICAPIVEAGLQAGPFQKLMNEAAMAIYNAHTHPGGGENPASPQMVADVHTTIALRGS